MSAIALAFTGSVIILDPHRQVASANVIDGWGRRQKLFYVGVGHIGVPKLEGAVEIRCVNGDVVQSYYVTRGVHTWLSVGSIGSCAAR